MWYRAAPVDRRPTALVAGALTLAAFLALVVVAAAAALDFVQDDPCKDAHPAWICPSGVVEAPYSITYKVSGEGAGPPFSFTMIWGTLPTGLTLRSDGVISGTPAEAGSWTFGLQLWDKAGNKGGDNDFVIRIEPRLLLQSTPPGPATIGIAYSHPVTAVMKRGPNATSPVTSAVTWSVASGTMPPGLALGADGVISGTPSTAGTYDLAVRGALIDGRADTQNLRITVRAPLVITPAGPAAPRSEVGVPYRHSLVASGGSGTYTWSLSAGSLPPGVVLGPTGTIAGKPKAAGAYRFTATAVDTEGRSATQAGAIVVAQRLAITTPLLRPAKVGRSYRQRIVTTGGVAPRVLRVTEGPLPRGIRFDRTLGVLSGTPTRPGTYRLTFLAMDALKVQATKTLTLVVTA